MNLLIVLVFLLGGVVFVWLCALVLRGIFEGEQGEVLRLAEPTRRVALLLQLLGADQVVELSADDVGPAPSDA